ncbi:MAG: HEPN domain-containing protein [Bryobacterales bacterium]|nr:HEPN domain-containing protein [Bryobacteraceae bacterium]MDW8353788.1 HEPN domain-containing protein [Bryobacterales bacterium]
MNRAPDGFRQAERDLAAARHAAGAGFHEWVAYGAQHGAEEALKALVEHLGGSLRGRSLTAILQRLG